MRVHRSLVALATGIAILVAPARSAAQIVEHRLPNGLQVLLLHDATSQTVDVDLGVLFGLSNDTLRGMAHFLEHLAMRETTHGTSLAGRYSRLGIDGGAFTDATRSIVGMGMRGGVAALDTLLSMQRQRLADLALSDIAVSSERNSVHTEIDGPADRAWMPALYPGSSLAHLARAHADIDRITPVSARAFYQKYYAPGNVTLVIESALPDTLVMRRVTAMLGTLPAQRPLPRPVYRDSTRVVAKRWIGEGVHGRRVLAITVPGPQHPWHGLVEAAERALIQLEDGVTPTVEIRLRNELPVSTLEIRVLDSPAANNRLDTVWRHFLEQIGASDRLTETRRPRLDAVSLVDCEAAGTWRYCLADLPITGAMQAGLLAAMRSAEGKGKPVVLWPAPVRRVPTDAQIAAVATATPKAAEAVAPREWRSPDMAPIVYRTTRGGLEWSARPGGLTDSVYMAVVLGPAEGNPAPASITAIEMLGRAWNKLRLPAGVRVDSLFRQQGIQVDVRSLPYPVLATTDNFSMDASVRTPLGVYGIELMITTPRARAATVLTTIHDILATAILDASAFESLKSRQLELLNATPDGGPHLGAERYVRERMTSVTPGLAPRFVPSSFQDQVARIQALSVDDVIAAARGITTHGAGRIVILGTEDAEASRWIDSSGLAPLGGLHWPGAAAQCPAMDTVTSTLGIDAANAQTWVYFTICAPAPANAVAAAARGVASRALTGSEAAIVAHRLRSELGMGYHTSTRLLTLWDSPNVLWQYEITTPTATVNQAIDEIRKQLAVAIATGPSEQLLGDTRTALITSRKQRAEDGIAWITSVLWYGMSPEQEGALIGGVTLEQVRAEIARGWRPEMMQVVHSAGRSGGSNQE